MKENGHAAPGQGDGVSRATLVEIVAPAGFIRNDYLVRGEPAGTIKMANDALLAPRRNTPLAQTVAGMTFRRPDERPGTLIDILMARKRFVI